MAISFKEKIAYVNKYAPKSNDKVQKLIKLAVNIDSAKLNLNDEQKNKLKDGVEKAFQQFKEKNESVKVLTPSQPAKKRGRPKGSGKKATPSASSSKAILQNFKAKVGKKVYKRATTRTNVRIDMERPAVKPGKRIVRKKGETSNQYGTFSNKPGRKYWENRANRMDVNQPSKTRYPKLAKGGMTQKEQQKLWWLNAPKKVQEDGVEYWSNRKRMWNNKEISLTKKEIAELVEVQKIIHENLPEYDHKFHSKLEDGGSVGVDNIGFGVMAKGGRTATNYAGKKSKETWGKHDLSKMYDNNLDLIADVVDYIQDLRKDVGESYARDFVYELMDVLKEGKITYLDGSNLKFEDGGEMADGGYEPYIYYFYDEDGNEITFRDIKEARFEAKQRGVQKFRDNVGGEYFIDYGNGGKMARGGYVSKGEMVWKKLSVNEKRDFLYKNFTPQITPRTQETLSGKAYNFLPKNVKIAWESKYANVENYGDGGSIAEGNYEMVLSKAKELQHHTIELQEVLKKEKDIEAWVVAKVERASQDLSDVTHCLDGMSEYGQGGKVEGNYVAVGEKDGYWTIITKPTTKEKAQKMLDIGSLPKDEVGKVVTVQEAKDHKKVIGREYLAQGGTLAGNLDVDNIGFGLMAKGGMTMQSIADKYEENEDENAHGENVVLLAKHFGTAQDLKEAKAILKKHMEEGHLSSENGAKRRELHMKLIAKARQEMAKEGVKFAKGGKLIGKQKNLDMNNNGILDKEDFQIIRSGKRIVRKNKK